MKRLLKGVSYTYTVYKIMEQGNLLLFYMLVKIIAFLVKILHNKKSQ